MAKKNSVHYELCGSSAAGEKKGFWRWAIFAPREKAGAGRLFLWCVPDAKKHVEAAISRFKERAQKGKMPLPK
jgi:hypothetical protein